MTELEMLLTGMIASLCRSLLMWLWLRQPLPQLFDQLCGRSLFTSVRLAMSPGAAETGR